MSGPRVLKSRKSKAFRAEELWAIIALDSNERQTRSTCSLMIRPRST